MLNISGTSTQHSNSEVSSDGLDDKWYDNAPISRAAPADQVTGSTRCHVVEARLCSPKPCRRSADADADPSGTRGGDLYDSRGRIISI